MKSTLPTTQFHQTAKLAFILLFSSSFALVACGKSDSKKSDNTVVAAEDHQPVIDETSAVYKKIRDEQFLGAEGINQRYRELNLELANWFDAWKTVAIYARDPQTKNLQEAVIGVSKLHSEQMSGSNQLWLRTIDISKSAEETTKALDELKAKIKDFPEAEGLRTQLSLLSEKIAKTSEKTRTSISNLSSMNQDMGRIMTSIATSSVIDVVLNPDFVAQPTADVEALVKLNELRLTEKKEPIGEDLALFALDSNDEILSEQSLLKATFATWLNTLK